MKNEFRQLAHKVQAHVALVEEGRVHLQRDRIEAVEAQKVDNKERQVQAAATLVKRIEIMRVREQELVDMYPLMQQISKEWATLCTQVKDLIKQ